MIQTVLFDLDGTLLPMDQDAFIKAYFGSLARRLAPHGYDAQKLIAAIWKGTEAMVRNDGRQTNEEVFWRCFEDLFGENARKDEPIFDSFYRQEFQNAIAACSPTPKAAEVIALCQSLGLRRVLATNPIFPAVATLSRIRWAGMKAEDFELITTYENAHFCKPNPAYYQEILDKQQLDPTQCLMVGNDVGEDMIARQLGMKVFLLTDCLINKPNEDISQYPHGSFEELTAFLQNLQA